MEERKDSRKESIMALQGILGNMAYEPEMKTKAWESVIEEKFCHTCNV